MSSVNYSTHCPVCGNEDAEAYSENKPFEILIVNCFKCGFATTPNVVQMSLEEINDYRKEQEDKPITEKQYKKYKKLFDKQFK